MLRYLTVVSFLFFFQFQYGQITELRRILPDSSTYATFNVVEKARFHIEAGEISKAEQFFFNALESGLMQSEDFLLFANCLMASNKKSLAREMFREYQNLSDNTLGPIADLVNSVLNVDTSQSYGRNLVAGSKGIYGLSSYDGKIYGNKDGYIFGYHAACPGEVGEGLYYNLGRHSSSIAAVSFYNSGYSAVYSYWDEKKRQYILCIVEREGSQWSKPIKLSFCNDGFNYLHPSVDEARGILYFSSDRSGGQGGFDIYVSNLRNGKFSEPVNVGSVINSFGNELYPNFHKGWLYFSSNGYPGFGGYDIFKYKSIDDFTAVLRNVRQLNSAAQDLRTFEQAEDQWVLYQATKAHSGLYFCNLSKTLTHFTGTVLSKTESALANAAVLSIGDDQDFHYVLTDMEGKFQLQSLRSDSLEIRVMVDGYYSKDFVLSSAWDNVVQMDLIQNVEIVKVIHLQGEDTSEVTYHASDSTEEDQFEERFDQIEKPRIKGVVLPDTNSFYVIVGSALDYDQAYRIWSLNKPNFPSLQIIQFGDRMYRVGFIAGSTELDAVSALRDAIDMKSDAWLIRPGTY